MDSQFCMPEHTLIVELVRRNEAKENGGGPALTGGCTVVEIGSGIASSISGAVSRSGEGGSWSLLKSANSFLKYEIC